MSDIITEIREALEEAPPGTPWATFEHHSGDVGLEDSDESMIFRDGGFGIPVTDAADAQLIVLLRNHAEELIERAEYAERTAVSANDARRRSMNREDALRAKLAAVEKLEKELWAGGLAYADQIAHEIRQALNGETNE